MRITFFRSGKFFDMDVADGSTVEAVARIMFNRGHIVGCRFDDLTDFAKQQWYDRAEGAIRSGAKFKHDCDVAAQRREMWKVTAPRPGFFARLFGRVFA